MTQFLNTILSKVFSINTTPLNQNSGSNQTSDLKTKHCQNLHTSLKQLEFISCFEMHLDNKKEDSYKLSFLQELARIKYSAEVNTIQSIQYCKAA